MKIKPEDLDTLRTLLQPVIDRLPIAKYRAANPAFSDKRIRWDYFHAAGQPALKFLCNTLYQYMNDEHMDTALKAIVGI